MNSSSDNGQTRTEKNKIIGHLRSWTNREKERKKTLFCCVDPFAWMTHEKCKADAVVFFLFEQYLFLILFDFFSAWGGGFRSDHNVVYFIPFFSPFLMMVMTSPSSSS